MAKVLRCPDCSHATPLDQVNTDVFPCSQCGRPLKVPAALRQNPPPVAPPAPPVAPPVPAPVPAPAPAPAPSVTVTSNVATVDPVAPPPTRAERQAAKRAEAKHAADYSMPKWLRFVVWIVAVPAALVLVLVPARLFRLVSASTLIDVVTGEQAVRFMSLVPFLAAWALAIAVLVMLGTDGVTWYVRRRRTGVSRSAAPAGVGSQTSH